MKLPLVNEPSSPIVCLEEFQQNVPEFRDTATQLWCEKCRRYSDRKWFDVQKPASFFIDKYSFRSWLGSKVLATHSELTDIPEIDFSGLFEAYGEIVRKSVVGSKVLKTKAPLVDEPVRRSPFLDVQFGAWQSHLSRNGVNLPTETIDWYFSVPLLEVYRNSVFYPRPPVLWGPNYFGKIADQDRNYILMNYGESAVWDFYFFMMVCHEQSHLMQKGEPILSEIAHAMLWIDFVLEQGLKPFQVNSETYKTCNIEAPFIINRTKDLKNLNYGLLYKDTLAYFEREVIESKYSHFVAMAFLVHAGVLRYRYLTNLFCGLLARDIEVVRYLRFNVANHVSEAIGTLLRDGDKKAAQDLVRSCMPTFGAIKP